MYLEIDFLSSPAPQSPSLYPFQNQFTIFIKSNAEIPGAIEVSEALIVLLWLVRIGGRRKVTYPPDRIFSADSKKIKFRFNSVDIHKYGTIFLITFYD